MLAKNLLNKVILPAFLIISQFAIAQNRTVTGKVTDSKDGNGIRGISVIVKGTGVGTQTSADGSFSLNVPANANTLLISSIGYASQEVDIAGKTSVDVSLVTTGTSLNEVVVT